MIIKEFKQLLSAAGSQYDDYRSVIRENRSSLGALATIEVKSMGFGIDWDHGKLIIYPDKPMIEKPKPKKIKA